MDPWDVVSAANEDRIAEGWLASYFGGNRSGVLDMLLTEYDAERQRELDRREGFEDGIAAGIVHGIEQGIAQCRNALLERLVAKGVITAEQADAERAVLLVADGRTKYSRQ